MKLETKKIMVFLIMAMLAVPAFALAGGIPDTGQTTAYDNEAALKAVPTTCGDEGCLRTFQIGDKTYSKFYDADKNEYSYYGFSTCYDESGAEITCTLTCKDKNGETVSTPPTKCYDSANETSRTVINCPTTATPNTGTNDFYGQDANYSINPRSYSKLGYGGSVVTENWKMVKDNRTGLIWEVKGAGAADPSFPNNSGNTYTWANTTADFLDKLNATGYGGYQDWRLPTAKELATIINCGKSNPAIDADAKTGYFLNMKADHYWTATSKSSAAYYVDFKTGAVSAEDQAKEKYVIAVRGTAASEAGRFIDNSNDGTVTDKLSGLMWKKNTVQVTGTYKTDWEGALASCQALVAPTDGYSDWRLPSRTELISLIDYSKATGVLIDTTMFPDVTTSAATFWTSTTYAGTDADTDDGKRTQAWCVNFADGTVVKAEKADEYFVLAVRGGQNEQPTTNLVLSGDIQTPPTAWILGQVMPIIWTTPTSIKGNVKISISSDGGKEYATIVESTPNDGSYVWWNIGQTEGDEELVASDTYMIKIQPVDATTGEPLTQGQAVQGLFSVAEDLGAGTKVDLSDVIKWLQVLVGN
jgi:hypothetical protein